MPNLEEDTYQCKTYNNAQANRHPNNLSDLEDVHCSQTSRTHDNSPSPKQAVYGDDLETNTDTYNDLVLCLSLNVNGLKHEKWIGKNNRLQQFLRKFNFDIMGFQETNINCDQIRVCDSCEEHTMGWWKGGNTSILDHNKIDFIGTVH